MDEVVDHRKFERVAYDRAVSLETTYAKFCKATELLLSHRLIVESIDFLNRLPLIMFEHDKAERALKFAQEESHVLHLPFHSCIVADSIGVVVLKNAEVKFREIAPELFGQFDVQFKGKEDS